MKGENSQTKPSKSDAAQMAYPGPRCERCVELERALRARIVDCSFSFLLVRFPDGTPRDDQTKALWTLHDVVADINPAMSVIGDDSGIEVKEMTADEFRERVDSIVREMGKLYLEGKKREQPTEETTPEG
ncbi:MAG: hypothetical protein GY937_19995 [bacterium]|nr:hypothetical protein [bacterium]